MEEQIHSLHLKRLQGRLGDIVYELTRVQYRPFRPEHTWAPALNAYLCRDHVCVCVDLAGVDKDSIRIRAESRRLLLQGRREPPEPVEREDRPVQVLALEIDYGPFARELLLPIEIDSARVTAEQRNGLLWINLPLRAAA